MVRVDTTSMTGFAVRRELRPGDAEAIVDLQQRLYTAEQGLDEGFRAEVGRSVREAVASGWPERTGAVWLVEQPGPDGRPELAGLLARTRERPGVGRVRWFILAPELRGHGLGRVLLGELLAEARAAGLERLELDTFSALKAAAHLYRRAGFQLVSQRETTKWGPPIVYQFYELQLR
jgi:GNAT superfamily N-acetyltransferase